MTDSKPQKAEIVGASAKIKVMPKKVEAIPTEKIKATPLKTDYLTSPLESATRKKIDLILNNLNWNTDEFNKNCNVFTERPRTEEEKARIKAKFPKGRFPDYVLYTSNDFKPIGIIEAKRPGQSLEGALKQAKEYAECLGITIIFAIDGAIIEAREVKTFNYLKIDGSLITDLLNEKTLLRFHNEGSELHSPERITYTKRELISIFSDANDLLREEGMREGIERFTEFSNLLFLKIISEIEDDKERNGEDRKLEKKFCWDAFKDKPAEEMLDYINKIILPRLVDKYNHSGDVFQSELKIKNATNLKRIVDKLSSLELLNADSDVKGDAFEYFLKDSVSVGNDLGEYFTPRHIVRLMTELIDPKFNEKVYDPCCGTGGFLIQAFRSIKKKVKNTKENIAVLEEKTVWGREITGTAKIAKMNMIIIGDGHINISRMDSLEHPIQGEFDVVLTNFPFSQTTKWSYLYGFKNKDANPVFLKHVIDALNSNGRAAVVVPDGLLFDKSKEYVDIRKILLTKCNVIAVIQLDPFVFKPYTGQPTSIILFEKGKQTEKIWFFDLINDGFKKTGAKKGRPSIEDNDIPLLRELWNEKLDSSNSFSISFDEIEKNNYKMTMNSYKKKTKYNTPIKLLSEICESPIIGGTPSRNNPIFWNGDNVWVTIGDMKDKTISDSEEKITDEGIEQSSTKKISIGTLLFSFKLTIGRVGFAGKELYTNEAITALVPLDKEDKFLAEYLYYMLPTIDYVPFAQRATKGYTLNSDTIGDVEIPYPDEETRIKIIKECQKYETMKKKLKTAIIQLSKKENSFIKQMIS